MNVQEDIKNAVETLRKGGIIIYPTDTVWGIGCDATNEEAVRRVYSIKQRSDSKAMICLTDSADRLQRYVRNVPEVAYHRNIQPRGEPCPQPFGRRRQRGHAHHQRSFLQGVVLPFPETHRFDKCQHQRTTCRTEFLRHFRTTTPSRRLCMFQPPTGEETSHAVEHHQDRKRR